MARAPQALALAGALAIALSGFGAVHAAPTITTIQLHGTKMANLAHGLAQVTQTAPGSYKVAVTISALPKPTTLKTTPIRNVYVAWAFVGGPGGGKGGAGTGKPSGAGPKKPSGPPQMGTMIPIPSHATSSSTYTGNGTVMLKQLPTILVTAEVSLTVHKPATPVWGVLIGFASHS